MQYIGTLLVDGRLIIGGALSAVQGNATLAKLSVKTTSVEHVSNSFCCEHSDLISALSVGPPADVGHFSLTLSRDH